MTAQKGPPDPIDELREQVADVQQQLKMMGPALAGLAGLDNVTAGIAQLVGVLKPIGTLVPAPKALDRATDRAIRRMKLALETVQAEQVLVPDPPFIHIGTDR